MKLQPLLPGKTYHFYNRGNNKENIFKEETNYLHFRKLLAKHLLPIVELYSYCLMPNHFHFVFRIKDIQEMPDGINLEKLHQPFSNFFNAYSKAFNKMYGRTGSLFQKHPKRILIEDDKYFKQLVIYINTNPTHHGFGDFRAYQYSSYHELIENESTILWPNIVVDHFDDVENFKKLLAKKKTKIDERYADEVEP